MPLLGEGPVIVQQDHIQEVVLGSQDRLMEEIRAAHREHLDTEDRGVLLVGWLKLLFRPLVVMAASGSS